MINIDFYLGVSLFVFSLISAIFIVWIFGLKQKDKKLTLDPKFLWFCSVCTYTYINTKEDTISVCPRCGSFNKK